MVLALRLVASSVRVVGWVRAAGGFDSATTGTMGAYLVLLLQPPALNNFTGVVGRRRLGEGGIELHD